MPPWQRKCLMAPDPAISRLACDALSVVWVATSQLVTQSRCRTVNSSPVNSSHLCLVKQSTRHTTKPSDAGEIVPRNSCSTWTVCRQEDIQEGVTENKWVMTWKMPNKEGLEFDGLKNKGQIVKKIWELVDFCISDDQHTAADRINAVIYWYHVGSQTFCDICR